MPSADEMVAQLAPAMAPPSIIDDSQPAIFKLPRPLEHSRSVMSLVTHPAVVEFSASVGMNSDMVVMIALTFLPLFLAPIYRLLGSAPPRALFDIIVGSLMLWALYGPSESLHFYALSAVALAIMFTTGKSAPQIVTVVSFSYLSIRHIIRHLKPTEGVSYDVDITGPMMMLVLKVVSMAYGFSDMTERMKKLGTIESMSLLTLSGYLLHHPTIIVGPTIRIDEYIAYTSMKQGDVPSPYFAAATKFVVALVFFALHIKFVILEPRNISDLANDEFAFSMNCLERLAFFYYCTLTFRFKFYAAWTMTAASLNLAGWGYGEDPETKEKNWDRVLNANPLRVELGANPRTSINNWNIRVSEWLREYVLNRIDNKNVGTMMSFLVSALWHGFSPNKFLFFLMLGTYLLIIGRNCRKAFHPIATSFMGGKLKPLYDVAGVVLHACTWNFIVIAWVTESLSDMYHVMKNLYFFGFILCAVAYVVTTQIISSRPREADKKRQ